jgi:hypothetical protein
VDVPPVLMIAEPIVVHRTSAEFAPAQLSGFLLR